MKKTTHRVYISTLVVVTFAVFALLLFYGIDYYSTNLEERFFHEKNAVLKPSGFIGHGIGILGSVLILTGVFGYMARKRIRRLSRIGYLKYWLEFHIFLCTLGPVLVLFHTSFKFGGLVSVSFWSMVAVVVSGIIGRFIYLQIPRTIEGRELSLNELNRRKQDFYVELEKDYRLDTEILSLLTVSLNSKTEPGKINVFTRIVRRVQFESKLIKEVKSKLKNKNIPQKNLRAIIRVIKSEIIIARRIDWLSTMQNFLRYWHVAHLPFAIIMLVIMIIHVAVAVIFGYKWIF